MKEMLKVVVERLKNPYFTLGVLGMIGTIFSAAGISVEALTSWQVLFDSVLSILANPFLLASVCATVAGIFVDPTTKGFLDKPKQ